MSNELNKENVAKLIAALRSGEYRQANGVLRDIDDAYCCLGVACDLSGLGKWEKREAGMGMLESWQYVIRDESGKVIAQDGSVLPWPVALWLGMNFTGDVRLPDYSWTPLTPEEEFIGGLDYESVTELASLNDDGLTFNQIADILEKADQFEWLPAPEAPKTGEDSEPEIFVPGF